MTEILMPKATAVWLVDNTSLTFDQIADFCGLHPLEVKGIADGEVARDIRGADPIANGQLSREELDKAQSNDKYRMKAQKSRHAELLKPVKKAPRYTPVSRRQDRPDAIAWFIRNHPEVADSQIARLLGTTKATIDQVRNRSHWNSANIKPVDPVTLGLATQMELDAVVKKAADKKAKDDARRGIVDGPTLEPASETGAFGGPADQDEQPYAAEPPHFDDEDGEEDKGFRRGAARTAPFSVRPAGASDTRRRPCRPPPGTRGNDRSGSTGVRPPPARTRKSLG